MNTMQKNIFENKKKCKNLFLDFVSIKTQSLV